MGGVTSILDLQRESIRPVDITTGPFFPLDTEAATISYISSVFHAKQSFTEAGDYDTVITLPNSVLPYHKAVPGTTDKFKGKLRELFPDIEITKEDIENLCRKRDASEPESS